MEIKVRGVKLYKSRGKVYAYHRRTGMRIRSAIGTAAFLAEIERLDGSVPVEPLLRPGSLGALIAAYRRSPEFLELAPRTRADYQKVMDYLKPLADDALIDITSAYVLKVRDAAFRAHKRHFANYALAVLRLLLKWGSVRDLVDTNQAATVPKLRRPRATRKANRAWDEDECQAVLEAATGGLKAGIALGMFAGMRQGDVIRLPRSIYDGGWLRWTQGKTGGLVELPVDLRLRDILEEHLSARSAAVSSLSLVAGARGRPYTSNGFRTMFFRLVRRLEAEGKVRPHLSFHGLRHTAGRLLADRGADPRTIAVLLGHKTLQMAAHYSEEADRKKRAVAAVARMRPRDRRG